MPITTCDSPTTLKAEIETARKKVSLDETEDTWDTIAQGISQLTRLCNNGGCEFASDMVTGIRALSRPLNSAVNSERSRLSGAAIELLTALAIGLGSSFEPLVSVFIPTLLALCGRTNKVFTSRARSCILSIVQHTRLPSLLPYLAELANHKSVFPRLTAAEGVLACLNCFNPPDLEKDTRARIVEDFIKSTARDANADVRKASKEVFKAYKTLMPGRVESFITPLTPVIKKYLDIQIAASGSQGGFSAAPKQTSRPPSRANNKVSHEAGQRPTASKPPAHPHPPVEDPPHGSRQRQVVNRTSAAVDVRPRQRTTSQIQRDAQPRNLQLHAQPSGTAQRHAIQVSAPTRHLGQPSGGASRVVPTRSTSATGGPQRPPPMQIKLNPPRDRGQITDAVRSGPKRVPLPPVAVSGDPAEQAPGTAESADRPDSTDKHLSKPPTRRVEPVVTGRTSVARNAPEVVRSTSIPAKQVKGASASTSVAFPRSHKPSTKAETSKRGKLPAQRQPSVTQQKTSRSLAKPERKKVSPDLVPLPPSPSSSPAEIPLPPSPICTPQRDEFEAPDQAIQLTSSDSHNPDPHQLTPTEACQMLGNVDSPKTPITTLLSSIQRGFLFTPSSPLSPPQNYLPVSGAFLEHQSNTGIMDQFSKDALIGAPSCKSPEEDAMDGLDRHALKDLN